MDKLRKRKSIEWIFEETVFDLQKVKREVFHLYDEYLIEIVEASDGKGYYAKIYELVANGSLYNDPETALKNAVSLLTHSRTVN